MGRAGSGGRRCGSDDLIYDVKDRPAGQRHPSDRLWRGPKGYEQSKNIRPKSQSEITRQGSVSLRHSGLGQSLDAFLSHSCCSVDEALGLRSRAVACPVARGGVAKAGRCATRVGGSASGRTVRRGAGRSHPHACDPLRNNSVARGRGVHVDARPICRHAKGVAVARLRVRSADADRRASTAQHPAAVDAREFSPRSKSV